MDAEYITQSCPEGQKAMILDERWLPVVGNDGYLVSDQGRVKRIKTGAIFSPESSVYRVVDLRTVGASRTVLVHRLVMAAFGGPCPPGLCVNHKNGNKHDNRLDNLEYVTPRENSIHARDVLGVRGARGYG